jgi:hypothetical protein
MTYTLTITDTNEWINKPVEDRGYYEEMERRAQEYIARYGGSAEIRNMAGTLLRYIDDTGRDWTNEKELATA